MHIYVKAEYFFIMNAKQYSFVELSKKTVVNVADGKELGRTCDMIFNGCGSICGLVVPGKKSLIKSITSTEAIYIPWNRIIKIGADIILVELVGGYALTMSEDASSDAQKEP